jgi:hypothetical protein
MYVCMYVCMCVWMYGCMYVCMYVTYVCMYASVCMYVCTYVCMSSTSAHQDRPLGWDLQTVARVARHGAALAPPQGTWAWGA